MAWGSLDLIWTHLNTIKPNTNNQNYTRMTVMHYWLIQADRELLSCSWGACHYRGEQVAPENSCSCFSQHYAIRPQSKANLKFTNDPPLPWLPDGWILADCLQSRAQPTCPTTPSADWLQNLHIWGTSLLGTKAAEGCNKRLVFCGGAGMALILAMSSHVQSPQWALDPALPQPTRLAGMYWTCFELSLTDPV